MKICVLTDKNNIITGYGIIENSIKPFENGTEVEIDLETIDLVSNYKLVDGKVVELTGEEKIKLFPPVALKTSTQELLAKQLLETQAIVANLQEQILLKTNGGK